MQLLTVQEAAERLRISKPTLYQLLKSGQLRSLKVGGSRRIPERELTAYIERELDSPAVSA